MALFVRDRGFYRSLSSLTAVIGLQALITFGVSLADNVMVGSYSQAALNGVAIVNQVQFLLQMFASGAANGIAVLGAQYWGQRRTEPIRRVFAAGFWVGFGLSMALAAALFFFPRQLLSLLTNNDDALGEGVKYARIIAHSYGMFAVTTLLLGVLRSVETVKVGFYVSCASLVVNISLNWLLIGGNLGCPELGVRGAAYATLAARAVEFGAVLIYALFIDKKLRLRLSDIFRVERGYVRDFMRTGLPLVASSGSWGIAMAVQTAVIGRLGSAAISANSIATTLFSVITVGAYSLASATSVVIGKTVGEGRIDDVKAYAKTLQIIFLLTGAATSLLLFAAKNLIVGLYSVTPESAALAKTFVNILCITVLGTCYQMPALTGIVSGGGETNFVFRNDLIFQWGIVLPVSILSAFVFKFPPAVTFFCLKSDQLLKCAVAVVKVNRFTWIRNVTHT